MEVCLTWGPANLPTSIVMSLAWLKNLLGQRFPLQLLFHKMVLSEWLAQRGTEFSSWVLMRSLNVLLFQSHFPSIIRIPGNTETCVDAEQSHKILTTGSWTPVSKRCTHSFSLPPAFWVYGWSTCGSSWGKWWSARLQTRWGWFLDGSLWNAPTTRCGPRHYPGVSAGGVESKHK